MKTKFFANSVLIAGGAIALLALWRHLYASGWIGPEAFASEARGPEPIVFAALATLFLASLRLRLALRVGIAVVSVSLLAVLYAAELVLASTSLGPAANLPFWSIDRASSQRKKDLSGTRGKIWRHDRYQGSRGSPRRFSQARHRYGAGDHARRRIGRRRDRDSSRVDRP